MAAPESGTLEQLSHWAGEHPLVLTLAVAVTLPGVVGMNRAFSKFAQGMTLCQAVGICGLPEAFEVPEAISEPDPVYCSIPMDSKLASIRQWLSCSFLGPISQRINASSFCNLLNAYFYQIYVSIGSILSSILNIPKQAYCSMGYVYSSIASLHLATAANEGLHWVIYQIRDTCYQTSNGLGIVFGRVSEQIRDLRTYLPAFPFDVNVFSVSSMITLVLLIGGLIAFSKRLQLAPLKDSIVDKMSKVGLYLKNDLPRWTHNVDVSSGLHAICNKTFMSLVYLQALAVASYQMLSGSTKPDASSQEQIDKEWIGSLSAPSRPPSLEDQVLSPLDQHLDQEVSDHEFGAKGTDVTDEIPDMTAEAHGGSKEVASDPIEITDQNVDGTEPEEAKTDNATSDGGMQDRTSHVPGNEANLQAEAADEETKKTDDGDSSTFEIVRGAREGTPASDMGSLTASEKDPKKSKGRLRMVGKSMKQKFRRSLG